MKKILSVVLFMLIGSLLFAQQKYALVIGNGNYASFGSLQNAVNDANDMADALQSLGFVVDKVLDGNRAQITEAITRLKNRLSVAENSYGFFYYAGHGVQYNGVNYLVPANADIPGANYLGDTAVPVQAMLAELTDAGNELNIVVLDACRDFPAAWSRSMNRGLAVVSGQPADSIIIYSTSAGSVALDGKGRNGLFTSHLLTHLKTPGLNVMDIFNRTGAAVARESNRRQIPAIYSQYFGAAYLDGRPASGSVHVTAPPPEPSSSSAVLQRGILFALRGDYNTAIMEFSGVIKSNPNFADAYILRGRVLYASVSTVSNAAENFNAVDAFIHIDGDNFPSELKMVLALAVEDFSQAIKLDANNSTAYYERGTVYYLMFGDGYYDKPPDYQMKLLPMVIADYTQAIRFNSGDAGLYLKRGLVYDRVNYHDGAIADFTQAIRLNPSNAEYYLIRGIAYSRKGDFDRAIADFTQSMNSYANSAFIYSLRGDAYLTVGDYNRAIEDYTRAVTIDPDNSFYLEKLQNARKMR